MFYLFVWGLGNRQLARMSAAFFFSSLLRGGLDGKGSNVLQPFFLSLSALSYCDIETFSLGGKEERTTVMED